MKLFNPIFDVVRYIKMYQIYLGFRMYLIYVLGIVASFLEGIGIIMLLPLLQSLDEGNDLKNSEGILNQSIYKLINFLGFTDSILSILILICIAFVLKGVVTFFSHGLTAILTGELLKEIKMKLFELYSKMSYSYFTSKNTGDLINLINEQPTKALEAFRQLAWLGSYLLNTIVLMSLAFIITFSFGIMALGLGILILILFLKMNSYVQNLSRIAAHENGTLTKWLIQSLHGFKYLISTNQINSLKKYVNNSISILTSTQIKSGVAGAFTQSVREPIAVLFIMVIVYVQIFILNLSLEPILVSIVLFYRALNSTLAVQSAFQTTFQNIGSMELVHEEFLNQRKHQFNNGNKLIGKFEKQITINNVTFNYDDSLRGVNNISLNIPFKSSIAIVGESGSGKTTLVDLITLTHQQQKGDIIIDGTNSREINQSSWKKQIGYVSQDTIIFDDTIANNISMWQDNLNDKETYNKLRNAAKKANILNFIESLEKGFNTVVGDRGILLSGGQKQRIFIARELFRNPNILILDEATSALDSESEKNIQDSIESLKGKITVIIIAHRLSTIKKVDNIYLLDKGKIIEKGSYDDLKNDKNSKFSEIVELQLL
jgi:ABC-type multidrug transport system fused ATPase/permease subunit